MRAWKLVIIGFIGASVIAVGANLLAMAARDRPGPGRVDIGNPSCEQASDPNDPQCTPRVAEDTAAQPGPIQIDFRASGPSESIRSSGGAGQPVSGGSVDADADQLRSDAGDDDSGEGHSGEGHSGEEGSGEEGSREDDSSEDD